MSADWIIAIVSLIAAIMNIYKIKWCFLLWGITNLAWMIYDIHIGANSQAALWGIYFFIEIWGLREWSKNSG
jgi:hypothetical protein